MKLRPRLMGLLAVMAASLAFAMFDRNAQTTRPEQPAQAAWPASKTDSLGETHTAPLSHIAADAPGHGEDRRDGYRENQRAARGEVDLFAAKSWYVAPPPPPPSKPEAPPFPYTITGSMSDGDDITLFLNQGERNFIMKKGDIVGGNYRLDDIADGSAEFTYLPLKERQHLQIGKIN